MSERMRCAFCNKEKAWPDGFPSTLFARCWPCTWDEHCRREHPVRPEPKRWTLGWLKEVAGR